MKTKTIKCNFTNSKNNIIDARLDLPEDYDLENNKVKAFIIFCHCFTCTKETITTFRLSRLLAENGYAVLRFDFMGLGNSEGDFAATTFHSTQDDLSSAIKFLEEDYQAPGFLMGHSLGGTTALSLAQNYNSVIGVVTIASPSKPEHVLHHFGDALPLLERGIVSSFEVAGQMYDIEPAFVDSVRSVDMQSTLSDLTKHTLIINIENDLIVNERNATQIQEWSAGATTLIDIAKSDHLLSNRDATKKVAGDIVLWMESLF